MAANHTNFGYPLYDTPALDTLQELILWCARTYGERAAFRLNDDAETGITYGELPLYIARVATYLNARVPQGAVAIRAEASAEWLLVYFACVCTGRVAVPLDAALDFGETKALLSRADCAAIMQSTPPIFH